MGVIGKLIGGTIGFALGGPLGAMAGAIFGHAFDSNNYPQDSALHRLSALEESQLSFFVSSFSMLAKVARVDGPVTEAEKDAVEAFAVRDIGLSNANREIALKIFHTAIDSPAIFEDFAIQFYHRFQNQPQMKEMMIDTLLKVSVADGNLNTAEETLILSAVRIFGLNASRYERIKVHYRAKENEGYAILGCSPNDTDDMIKKKYRQLVQTYHPDKIASKELPEEFIQLATDKFRKIQSAYEKIKKERGFN